MGSPYLLGTLDDMEPHASGAVDPQFSELRALPWVVIVSLIQTSQ